MTVITPTYESSEYHRAARLMRDVLEKPKFLIMPVTRAAITVGTEIQHRGDQILEDYEGSL